MEFTLQNSPDREVPSERIGELAMEKLKDIDEVAYVRFASVYRQFQDIQTFMDELKSMMKTEINSGIKNRAMYMHGSVFYWFK